MRRPPVADRSIAAFDPNIDAERDHEILRQILAGSDRAFAELVDRYQERAFWVAFHVLGRVEDARDVTQEAFVRVFRSLARFDFSRSFYTWFYRIVMNLAIDALRKAQSSRAAQLDDQMLSVPDDRDDVAPAHGIEQDETRRTVWLVLSKLDPRFRTVIVLRDLQGLSCREIAPILEITHATVRWRLHRGRQLFKEHWERMLRRFEARRDAESQDD